MSTQREYSNYKVDEEQLAYRLVDAGLFYRMYKRLPDRHAKDKIFWLFDKVPEVKAVIDQYYADKEKEII